MSTKSKLRERKDGLQANLVELIEACPVDQCNPEECPLYELRRMARSKRSQWFKALNEDDLVYLADYHYTCLFTKVPVPLSETCP